MIQELKLNFMFRLLLLHRSFSSFNLLSQSLHKIQSVPGRLLKIQIFSQYLQTLSPQEAATLKNLFNLSFEKFSRIDDRLLEKNCEILMVNKDDLEKMLIEENDVLKGISKLHGGTQGDKDLSVEKVYEDFIRIKEAEGKNSTNKKFEILQTLLSSATSQYQKRILLSLLTNNLQIGFNKTSILKSFNQLPLNEASTPSSATTSKQKYECMLTKPLKDFIDATKFINKSSVSVQYKFDGERTHIQYKKGEKVTLFSRRGKSQDSKYQTLLDKIEGELGNVEGLESCVLDGQIIAVDREGKVINNIQVLLNRNNRGEGEQGMFYEKIMVFDVLQKNGQSLIDIPYEQRIKQIPNFKAGKALGNVQREFFSFPDNTQDFKIFFQKTVKLGYEGLILKKTNSKYNITKSRTDWAKLKKGDSQQGTSGRSVDIDLIMMGAYKGKGKRLGVLGSFLFGTLYNRKIYPISKIGSSLTDIKFKQVTSLVQPCITSEIPEQYVIPKNIDVPDFWIKPQLVVEISAQEWSRSPVYQFDEKKGKGGLSLRFPKFIRVRDDKRVQDATRGQEILELVKENNESNQKID